MITTIPSRKIENTKNKSCENSKWQLEDRIEKYIKSQLRIRE